MRLRRFGRFFMSKLSTSLDSALRLLRSGSRGPLTRELVNGLPKNGATDPILFYKAPLVGPIFRERINRGLALLPDRPLGRVLEIAYAAGAVLLALAPRASELLGLDLDADPGPVQTLLAAHGHRCSLAKGSVYEMPYEAGSVDVVVCFSLLEHLDKYPQALAEIGRVLTKGGLFLLGMPAVNLGMSIAFRSIGFPSIGEHHITTPASVAKCFASSGFSLEKTDHLDFPLAPPLGVRLYYNWLLRRM
jgi:SAM-dependent methyltransferase